MAARILSSACRGIRHRVGPAARRLSSLPDDAGEPFVGLGLSQDQMDFRDVAEDFARNELLPFSAQWDSEKHFPVETLRHAASLGFGGIYCGEDVGGTGLARSDAAIIFEALAYGDVSATAYLTIHNMVCGAIDKWGTPEQREAWLPSMTSMDLLSSYCLTEPGSGSDAASLQTVARRDGGDYVLNGAKAFISGGGVADVYLVMARSGEAGARGISAFLVEKGTPGLSFGKQEEKMGWRSQPTSAVILEDARVPAAHRLGGEGDGFKIAMGGLDGGRINIASCSVGGAQFALDTTLAYVQDRRQFGRSIADFQNTQFRLADMFTDLQAARLLVRSAAASLDAGAPTATSEAAVAKRFATDACYGIANDALQLHGGYGFLMDYPVERVVRDLRVHTILEGTNEIMRVIIARGLLQGGH